MLSYEKLGDMPLDIVFDHYQTVNVLTYRKCIVEVNLCFINVLGVFILETRIECGRRTKSLLQETNNDHTGWCSSLRLPKLKATP